MSPEINALATIIVLLVAVGIIASGILPNQVEKRRKRDTHMAMKASE